MTGWNRMRKGRSREVCWKMRKGSGGGEGEEGWDMATSPLL